MNGKFRMAHATTIEDRLAAAAVAVLQKHPVRSPFPPDYADFRDAFRPLVRLEILVARLEALGTPPQQVQERKRELVRQLLELNLDWDADPPPAAPPDGATK